MTTRPTVDYLEIIEQSGIPTTEQALEAELKKAVEDAGSQISNDSKMSPWWRLIKAVVLTPMLWLLHVLLAKHVLPNLFAATAKGFYADLKAWEVGLERKDAVKTRGVIKFFKEDPDADVLVPAGTIVSTERMDDKVYQVVVLEETLISASLASGLVVTEALEAGEGFNLSAGYFSVLPEAIPGITHAVNPEDWITTLGSEEENDDELMIRARNQFTAAGNYHIDAVYRSIITDIAGVRGDLVFFKNTGDITPGSAESYILMEVGNTPSTILDALNQHIMSEGYHGHGDIMTCKAIPETLHDVTVEAFVSINLDEQAKTNLLNEVQLRVKAAFRLSGDFDSITRTLPKSRFSLSNLGHEIHRDLNSQGLVSLMIQVDGQQNDIVSALDIPRIQNLTVVAA